MLVYEKKVKLDPLDPSSEEVRRLLGTKASIPSNSDELLVYKDNSAQEIAPTVAETFKYVYNKDGGIFASTNTYFFPQAGDTAVNVFLSDETPVIVTNDASIYFTVNANASNGAFDPTTASVLSTASATFTLTAATGYSLPESISIEGIVSTYTYSATSGEVVISKPGSKVIISAKCIEE